MWKEREEKKSLIINNCYLDTQEQLDQPIIAVTCVQALRTVKYMCGPARLQPKMLVQQNRSWLQIIQK